MADTDTFDQDISIYEPAHQTGTTLAIKRRYRLLRTVKAHVKPLPAVETRRLQQVSSDVTHNLWFEVDPQITEVHRVKWGNAYLRPVPSINLHGLSEVWLCQAKLLSNDEETITIVS